ncbi:predicted protein [Methanosarcina acetivorans C2A]|uniref:Uncharacterized protein n=1 Tax=Methanosarcina acetivorans (strain ATCC 35395 / DSM 2834 / JCM 12185 / C2A) TaxID=188937 RepID=Q8TKH2_METAC|nr:predicted protein [Methanosarcina acetivorans C2A]
MICSSRFLLIPAGIRVFFFSFGPDETISALQGAEEKKQKIPASGVQNKQPDQEPSKISKKSRKTNMKFFE